MNFVIISVAVTVHTPLGQGTLLKDITINSIAKNYNKTAAQVLIRFQVERNVAVIPKSSHNNRIKENFDVLDFSLTKD